MGSFKMMSRAELRIRRKLPAEDLILFDQFKGYLTRMNGNDVVVYDFSKGEDRDRCKQILRRAAKGLNLRIRILDESESLIFYPRVRRGRRSGAADVSTPRT